MSDRKVKKGDRVIFTDFKHRDTPSSPHYGGKYGYIVGTVMGMYYENQDKNLMLTVAWDNGQEIGLFARRFSFYEGGDKYRYRVKNYSKKAKEIGRSILGCTKPYRKYVVFAALAIALDHFVLNGKFRKNFKKMMENLADKMIGGVEQAATRATDHLDTDTVGK